ncbi:adhesion G protein-coupled receptor E5-like isoform X1 [Eublepharis macularius]|uniref:Adhesion G protein-coupled receptor E5-like isoform X1 n=1 Tax=Eublepharis macularius TaxID=481883 RepID=A0AA97KPQ0_EUBMA|nr:adhesion G protein-coupled receptor E5-like isoform X1 [Eublepharis macularius]
MASSPAPLLSLGFYIILDLSSAAVLNSIASEPINHNESFSCLQGLHYCDSYDEDDKKCCDINECSGPNKVECGRHTTCTNTNGNYYCSCIDGFYSSTGKKFFMNATEATCSDIDECQERNKCGNNTECVNTPGSYTCHCKAGFQKDFKNASVVICNDIDECQQNASICEPNGSCINTIGDYLCKCKPGFGKSSKDDRKICKDIDECATKPCSEGASCKNYPGGFWCQCLPGYISYTEAIPGSKPKSSCKPFSCSASSSNNCSDGQTFICNFTGQLDSICNSSWSAQNHRDKEILLKDMLHLLDEQVSSSALKSESKEERHHKVTELMREVESWLRHFSATLANTSISIESSKGTELDMEIRTAGNLRQSSVSLLQNETQMELSWNVSNREDKAFSLIGLLTYQSLGPLLTGARIEGSEREARQPSYEIILSKVAAAFIGHENTMSLNISVNFTFNHTEAVPANFSSSSSRKLEQRLICAFWEPVNQSWSTEGCELMETNGNSTRCKCDHLTSFAVLMAFYEVEDPGLEVITKIGLIFSLICLFLSILTFLFCRSIRGIRTTIHLHLCLTLFAAHVIFLVGAGNTVNKTACAIVAGLLHYFFLSAFCWMLLEGVELYLMVVQVFRTPSLKHWHHMLVGYGVPAVMVGIAAAINHQGYGTEKHCWLSMEHGFLWSFLAPVCLIILINSIVFVVTIWKLTKKFADINPDMNQLKKQKVLVITAIAQLCILGTTWIFGMFQFSDHSLVMSYIYTILNSLQGLFIFVLHCLLKKQVRDDYCRLFCQRGSGKPQSSDKYSEFNSTATFNTLRPQKSSQESGI